MKIILTRTVPKKAVACAEVRETPATPFADIMDWAAQNVRGTLWWSKTQFRDPKTSRAVCFDSRKRHFDDGYWVYRFWFSRKADAAMFVLSWGSLNEVRPHA